MRYNIAQNSNRVNNDKNQFKQTDIWLVIVFLYFKLIAIYSGLTVLHFAYFPLTLALDEISHVLTNVMATLILFE